MNGDATTAFVVLACVQAVIAIVLVAATSFYAWRTHDMANEMRLARELQARSNVQLRLEHNDWNPAVIQLVLQNAGAGAALNVRVVFTPDIWHPLLRQKGTNLRMSEIKLFKGVARIAGGQQIVTFFDTSMHYFHDSEFPDTLTCSLTYTDEPSGSDVVGTVVLEPRLLENMTPIWDHPMKNLSDGLAKLAQHVEAISKALSK